MKRHTLFVFMVLTMLVLGGTTISSAQDGWKKLGDEHVNHDVDHDSIHVADSGRMRELRLRVEDAPVSFKRIVITYTDGQKQDVEYLENVAVGRDSSIVPISGDGHAIKEVEFWYETASLGGKKAHVTLFGREYMGTTPTSVVSSTAVVPAAVVTSAGGWKNLGDENVNFDVDHDVIHIADSGRFRELRLSVKNAPIKFRRVVVTYTDGTKEDLEYLEDVAVGHESRVIALTGDGHVIKSVEFWYETASLGGKKAHVTLFGRG
jgi:hypothetical protein